MVIYNVMQFATCRSLHHPNVLTLIDIMEKDKITLVTNYVVGKNLFELLHQSEKVPRKIILNQQ